MTDLQTLGLAYRKAKVDLYYSSNASLDAIADYEENLHAKLSVLLEKINGEDESWVKQKPASLAFGHWPANPSIWMAGSITGKRMATA